MRLANLHQRLADFGALPVHNGRVVCARLQGKPLNSDTRRQRNGLPQRA